MALTSLTVRKAPSKRVRGRDDVQYEATWYATAPNGVSGGSVLALAQLASTDRVPQSGEALRWTKGGTTYTDLSVQALDFQTDYVQAVDEFPGFWMINVTWRRPTPGADERQPNVPPLAREPEYWIEYSSDSEEVTEGRNIIGIGSGSITRHPLTLGALTTAAAELVPGFYRERLRAVLVSQKNVASPGTALRINDLFEDTVNDSTWRTPFVRVKKHHAKFLRAETTGQVQEGFAVFHRMQTRVEIGRRPFYINLPNRGIQRWDSTKNKVITNRDDDGVVQEVNLKQDGTLFDNDTPITIPYITHTEANYSRLPF